MSVDLDVSILICYFVVNVHYIIDEMSLKILLDRIFNGEWI